MKKLTLSLILLITVLASNAQYLSISKLIELKNADSKYVSSFLLSKKFYFIEGTTNKGISLGDNTEYNYFQFGYNYDTAKFSADAFFYYIRNIGNTKTEGVQYIMTNKSYYSNIISDLSTLGFKKGDTKRDFGSLTEYKKYNLLVRITVRTTINSNNTLYVITIINIK